MDKIKKLTKERAALLEAMQVLHDTALDEDRDLTDEEDTQFKSLEAQTDALEVKIDRLQAMEERAKKYAAPVEDDPKPEPEKRSYGQMMAKWKQGGEPVHLFARQAIALYHGGNRFGAAEYAKSVMQDEVLAAFLHMGPEEMLQRAAIPPSTTTDPTSAAPLVAVREAAEQFIDLLRPRSVYARIAAGASLTFGRDGAISIPKKTAGTSGGWVGEGKAIPVNRVELGTVTMTPRKMAVLAFSTQELMDHSNPSMQSVLTDDLLDGAAITLDKSFTDKVAASPLRPAGLQTFGTSTASAGKTLEQIITDVKAAEGALVGANVPMRSPVWIMSEVTRIALKHVRDTVGQTAFPEISQGSFRGYPIVSSNSVGNILMLLDSSFLLKGLDMAPMIDSSNDATINADDAPASENIKDAAVTTPVYSMFQTDQVAVRMRHRLDWNMRHGEAVHTITGIDY